MSHHPRDQWFRFYDSVPGEIGPIVDSKTKEVQSGWTKLPVWGPSVAMLHVHHPEFYHPDPKVRVRHHREMIRSGIALTACGIQQDPRRRYIEEEHDIFLRCPDCVRVTEDAKTEHEKISADRVERARLRALEDQAKESTRATPVKEG